MATTYVQRGNSIDYTPSSDITAGDVVVQGELVGVAKLDIATGILGALAVSGVFDFPKTSGASTEITAGTKVYWDATNKVATSDSASGVNKYIGKTVADAGDDAELVRVRLEQ